MQALRDHFTGLGLSGVETFIASGNVLFDAPGDGPARLEARIEAHLHAALGYDVATFLRTPAEIRAVATFDAFPGSGAGEPGYPLYVAFTRSPVGPDAMRALDALRNDVDDLAVRGREVYWACRTSISQSTFSGARLERIIGMPATLRSVTTVRKLAALAASPL